MSTLHHNHDSICVAIDGPAGAGKSTVAKAVAKRLGFMYVDTGAMYRAVALKCLREGVDVGDPREVERAVRDIDLRLEHAEGGVRVFLEGEDVTGRIRSREVGEAVSKVSTVPAVREALVRMQRELGARGGVVMDGRDIGTVVLPDAEVKVFLTASIEERARRRQSELLARGDRASFDEVLASIQERDERDSTRDVSPLRKADDAVEIDTTGKSVESVVQEIVELCLKRGKPDCSTR